MGKRIVIVVLLIVMVVAALYSILGGGGDIKFEVVTLQDLYIKGHAFKGNYNSPKAEELFFAAKNQAEINPNASLTIVSYPSKDKGKTIHQFIGASSVKDSVASLEGELLHIPSQQVIQATISAHNLVMPTPNAVREQAQAFASANGYELDSISIEHYKSDRELQVTFLVYNKP